MEPLLFLGPEALYSHQIEFEDTTMETKTILVTGGAGFMGSWLVDELIKRGNDVISVDNMLGGFMRNVNKNCLFIKAELREKEDGAPLQ
jgi:nucleoside-diphosphate-sugar epimerase